MVPKTLQRFPLFLIFRRGAVWRPQVLAVARLAWLVPGLRWKVMCYERGKAK